MIQFWSIVGIVYLASTIPPMLDPSDITEEMADPAAASRGLAGLKVVMDPVTGKILENPTAAELEAVSDPVMSTAPRRSSWELRSFSLPGGGEGVAMEKWAHHSLTLKRTGDGELHFQCAQGDVHQAPSQESAKEQR